MNCSTLRFGRWFYKKRHALHLNVNILSVHAFPGNRTHELDSAVIFCLSYKNTDFDLKKMFFYFMQYFYFIFGECYIYNLSVYVAVIIFVSNSTPKSLLHNHLKNILQSNVKEREQIQIQSTLWHWRTTKDTFVISYELQFQFYTCTLPTGIWH